MQENCKMIQEVINNILINATFKRKKSQNCITSTRNNSLLLRASKNRNILRIFYHIMNLILFLGEKSVFHAVQLVLPAAFLSNFVWRHILREKAGNIICHTNIIHFVCFLLVSLMQINWFHFLLIFFIYQSIKTFKLKHIKIGKLNDKMRNILRIQIGVINKSAKVGCANLVLMCKL